MAPGKVDKQIKRLTSSAIAGGHGGLLKHGVIDNDLFPAWLEAKLAQGFRLVAAEPIPGTKKVAAVIELKGLKNPSRSVFLTADAKKRAARIAVKTGRASGVDVPESVRALANES